MFLPATKTWPWVGMTSRVRVRSRVVLPEPEGPVM